MKKKIKFGTIPMIQTDLENICIAHRYVFEDGIIPEKIIKLERGKTYFSNYNAFIDNNFHYFEDQMVMSMPSTYAIPLLKIYKNSFELSDVSTSSKEFKSFSEYTYRFSKMLFSHFLLKPPGRDSLPFTKFDHFLHIYDIFKTLDR